MAEQLGEGLNKLKDLTKKLEDPRISLEDAMAIYEAAVRLETKLRARITNAEMRVEIIGADGKIEPFTDKMENPK